MCEYVCMSVYVSVCMCEYVCMSMYEYVCASYVLASTSMYV